MIHLDYRRFGYPLTENLLVTNSIDEQINSGALALLYHQFNNKIIFGRLILHWVARCLFI